MAMYQEILQEGGLQRRLEIDALCQHAGLLQEGRMRVSKHTRIDHDSLGLRREDTVHDRYVLS